MHEQLHQILMNAITEQASDVHICADERVFLRIEGALRAVSEPLLPEVTRAMADSFLTDRQQSRLVDQGSVDGGVSLGSSRFRFNVYRRQGALNLAFRLLPSQLATLPELGLNDSLYRLATLKDGLVLVAGPTGSGKSTTIAAFMDRINQTRDCHLITIEDPVEFLHPSQRALVNQREIGRDVETFGQALVDAVRQDPDVILVGELRDLQTIRTAVTAAETGHLVFASVHAGDAKTAIERLVSSYAAGEQDLAQRLVATVLRAVIVQHLLPRYENPNQPSTPGRRRRVLASEVLHVNSAASNLIANGNLSQLAVVIESGGDEGMWTLDMSLANLLRKRLISEQTARTLARHPEMLAKLSLRVLS